MSFAYAASTDGCTFLLDEDGVCLRVVLRHERRSAKDTTLGGRTRDQAARRCIGAQYVASIDVRVEGALVPMPRVGMPMLFAYTGDDGRIAVVRTGRLVKFETLAPAADEIPVEWDRPDDARGVHGTGADADGDDQCQTIPLHQSGERKTPRMPLYDTDAADTMRDPWIPPPRPTWSSLPSTLGVRLQKVNVVPPGETKGTSRRMAVPAGRGMLPKKAGRI
ncbi:MAG TPA: hypothetical protein VIY73_21935 [Polyangiaceae bacterium]